MQKSDKIEAILKIDKLTEKNNSYLKRNLNVNHRKSIFENLVSIKSTKNDRVSKQAVGSGVGKFSIEQSKNRSKSSDQGSSSIKLTKTPVTDLKRIQRNQVK